VYKVFIIIVLLRNVLMFLSYLDINTAMMLDFINYAFHTFDLHRITANTDCENIASVALLEQLGMRREGHFIQNIWFKGKWGDEYLYAILKEEWRHKSNYRQV
jgi:RimJ/RimL family protein N-acetyltransferase